MKKHFFYIMCCAALMACDNKPKDVAISTTAMWQEGEEIPASTTAAATPIECSVTGDIDLSLPNEELVGREASVSFSRFPNSIAEFCDLHAQLASTPQGAMALELIAMEMYRRHCDGDTALRMVNTSNNMPHMLRRCQDLFCQNADQSYKRPYQVAGFLKGAAPSNGYKPESPYTIEVKVGPNGAQYSNDYQTKVVYMDLRCVRINGSTGDESWEWRSGGAVLSTKKPGEPNDGYCLMSCGILTSQVPEISFSESFEELQ